MIIILLLIWTLTANIVDQPEFFPSLPRLLSTLVSMVCSGSFYLSVGATLLRGLAGMGLSLILALFFAGLFARWEWLYEFFRPLLVGIRSVPVISFILIALIFLHPESIPLLIGFLTMFPLLTENLTRGMQSFDPKLRDLANRFRLSRMNRLTQIYYPQLNPFLFSGLSSAAGFGWRAIIMGEVLSQCTLGIGSEMKQAQSFIDVPALLAWTLVAIVVSFLSDKIIQWISGWKIKISFTSQSRSYKMPLAADRPIVADKISYHYGITRFSYCFELGKIYGISAPSGTGKTTLLNLLGGTLIPTEGKLTMDTSWGISSVFEEPLLLPHLTAAENVALVISPYNIGREAVVIADALLCLLELKGLSKKYPSELSYGQQQRVALARALIYPSPFLFMDEPFKGLDRELRERIITAIRQYQKGLGLTVIFTSHQADELSSLADTVIGLP